MAVLVLVSTSFACGVYYHEWMDHINPKMMKELNNYYYLDSNRLTAKKSGFGGTREIPAGAYSANTDGYVGGASVSWPGESGNFSFQLDGAGGHTSEFLPWGSSCESSAKLFTSDHYLPKHGYARVWSRFYTKEGNTHRLYVHFRVHFYNHNGGHVKGDRNADITCSMFVR
jgi:hypothetical protein